MIGKGDVGRCVCLYVRVAYCLAEEYGAIAKSVYMSYCVPSFKYFKFVIFLFFFRNLDAEESTTFAIGMMHKAFPSLSSIALCY